MAVAGVVLVAGHPANHRGFMERFAGMHELSTTSAGILFKTPRGTIEVVTPSAYVDRFGTSPPDSARGARLAALRFAVRDPGVAEAVFKKAAIRYTRHGDGLVVGPDVAMGSSLVFGLD